MRFECQGSKCACQNMLKCWEKAKGTWRLQKITGRSKVKALTTPDNNHLDLTQVLHKKPQIATWLRNIHAVSVIFEISLREILGNHLQQTQKHVGLPKSVLNHIPPNSANGSRWTPWQSDPASLEPMTQNGAPMFPWSHCFWISFRPCQLRVLSDLSIHPQGGTPHLALSWFISPILTRFIMVYRGLWALYHVISNGDSSNLSLGNHPGIVP